MIYGSTGGYFNRASSGASGAESTICTINRGGNSTYQSGAVSDYASVTNLPDGRFEVCDIGLAAKVAGGKDFIRADIPGFGFALAGSFTGLSDIPFDNLDTVVLEDGTRCLGMFLGLNSVSGFGLIKIENWR